MTETETPVEHPAPAAAPKRRRAPARRKASSRKPAARRKKAPARSRDRGGTGSLTALLESWGARAAAAGKGLKTLSGLGADVAKQAFQGAGTASKKTIARLTKEWESLDAKRRAQLLAALLAALAAASTPIVRNRLTK